MRIIKPYLIIDLKHFSENLLVMKGLALLLVDLCIPVRLVPLLVYFFKPEKSVFPYCVQRFLNEISETQELKLNDKPINKKINCSTRNKLLSNRLKSNQKTELEWSF